VIKGCCNALSSFVSSFFWRRQGWNFCAFVCSSSVLVHVGDDQNANFWPLRVDDVRCQLFDTSLSQIQHQQKDFYYEGTWQQHAANGQASGQCELRSLQSRKADSSRTIRQRLFVRFDQEFIQQYRYSKCPRWPPLGKVGNDSHGGCK
jgi:hypothetical protein